MYAQAFEEKRRHPQPPNLVAGKLMQVTDLHWLSSFEFAATYLSQDPNSNELFLVFLSTPVRMLALILLLMCMHSLYIVIYFIAQWLSCL